MQILGGPPAALDHVHDIDRDVETVGGGLVPDPVDPVVVAVDPGDSAPVGGRMSAIR
ncbi:hypothetical protein QC334_33715 [Streptomyces sp. DH18]|uniref:hypothetical protein n=1 Tax=Streptomyces sp. DH18 TaxID=3040126 RepID=UPI002442FD09|nr:hypothetical protein [Streptomyces sp. DH18]MDG9687631.1 hypothetical protein [Streptomyces sp. DH18]